MEQKAQKPNPTRSAAQKIADLENAVMSLFNVVDNLAKDLTSVKAAMKLLNNKVSSIVKASANGESVNDEVLDRIMVENNCAELAQRVENMVAQKIVTAEEAVSANAFVVGSELDDTDKVVNPRLQFALKALSPELQAKLLGAKVGDTLVLEEGKLKFKVLESYKIAEPSLAPTTEAPTEAPAEPAQAAQ